MQGKERERERGVGKLIWKQAKKEGTTTTTATTSTTTPRS